PLVTTAVPWLIVQFTLVMVSPPGSVSSSPTLPSASWPGPCPLPEQLDAPGLPGELQPPIDGITVATARPRMIALPMTDFFTMNLRESSLDCGRVSDDARRLFKTRATRLLRTSRPFAAR